MWADGDIGGEIVMTVDRELPGRLVATTPQSAEEGAMFTPKGNPEMILAASRRVARGRCQ